MAVKMGGKKLAEGSLNPVELANTNWLPYVAVEVSGSRMVVGKQVRESDVVRKD